MQIEIITNQFLKENKLISFKEAVALKISSLKAINHPLKATAFYNHKCECNHTYSCHKEGCCLIYNCGCNNFKVR
jgi:hypothetical protein